MAIRVRGITSQRSPGLFLGIVIATLFVVFVAKHMMDAYSHPALAVAVAKDAVISAATAPIHAVEKAATHLIDCRLAPVEVFSEAEFTSVGISPAEAQGVDSRWEEVQMVRKESEGFVRGAGSAGGDCAPAGANIKN
jgi:hypothetical protein